MKQPHKKVRDINGQNMIVVPDGVPLGNVYEGVLNADGSFTFYPLRSSRPVRKPPTPYPVIQASAARPTIEESE